MYTILIPSEEDRAEGQRALEAYARGDRNPDGSLKHIICEGVRFHVVHWTTQGSHCSEPECEINRQREARW